ncbi:hypothetical protein MYX07_03080 [Patescibacteria group bacterium AH-259-L07]|nr:hypothetical protein [Patescibacteria group bacterium AH-259-L07]
MKSETKTCQNCKSQFTIEPDDFDFYNKIKVPPPTFCPECRLRRRFMFRNERILYKRKCDLCKKEVISIYSQDKDYKVYCPPCWWSDKWDAQEYGREYDFSLSFFEQFDELMHKVPHVALIGIHKTLVNSEYTNQVGSLKNCYLITNSDYDERCYYASGLEHSFDCFDMYNSTHNELCYDSLYLAKCNRVFFSQNSEACVDSLFLKDCIGCVNCFGCINLRNQQYHIFNKKFSPEGYKEELRRLGFDSGSYISSEAFHSRAKEFWSRFPNKFIHARRNKNISGDYIYNSKNTHDSFDVNGAEDSRYCTLLMAPGTKAAYDYTEYGDSAELIYETQLAGLQIYNIKFSHLVWSGSRNVEYSYLTPQNCSNIFGCVSLRNQNYCILNKKYKEGEYFDLRDKIIQHMQDHSYKNKIGHTYTYGEFFPPDISPFCYNETTAQEFFTLNEKESMSQGYQWKGPETRNYQISLQSEDLPDHIRSVSDAISKEIISCAHQGTCNENCTTAFQIISAELQFYKKMNLPLPRLCPNCRHSQRLKQRNPLKLWTRKCQCAGEHSDNKVYKNTAEHFHSTNHCSNEFKTSYSPEREEIVYCEKCYQSEVV